MNRPSIQFALIDKILIKRKTTRPIALQISVIIHKI